MSSNELKQGPYLTPELCLQNPKNLGHQKERPRYLKNLNILPII